MNEYIVFCDVTGQVWCKCACVWSKWLWKEFVVSDTWRGN